MLLITDRVVPQRAPASSLSGDTTICPSSTFTSTEETKVKSNVPFDPFTEIVFPFTDASTPLGSATGNFQILDIIFLIVNYEITE